MPGCGYKIESSGKTSIFQTLIFIRKMSCDFGDSKSVKSGI